MRLLGLTCGGRQGRRVEFAAQNVVAFCKRLGGLLDMQARASYLCGWGVACVSGAYMSECPEDVSCFSPHLGAIGSSRMRLLVSNCSRPSRSPSQSLIGRINCGGGLSLNSLAAYLAL